MKIGDRIRYRREELEMSQDELARRLGYKSRSSINKIEKDASGLPQTKIAAIAEALRTTPSYIMGWDEEEQKNKSAIMIDELKCLSDAQIKLFDFVKSVPDDKAEMVLRVVKSIVEAD